MPGKSAMMRSACLAITSLSLVALGSAASAGEEAGQALDEGSAVILPADGEIGDDIDPRAEAILAVLSTLSQLPGEVVSPAIADLLVGFTAATDSDDFMAVLDMWFANLEEALQVSSLDGNGVLEAMVGMRHIDVSSGVVGVPVVHLLTDLACEPCRGTLSVLADLSEAGDVNLRVTPLPFLGDDSLPIFAGLEGQEDAARVILGIATGAIDPAAIAVETPPIADLLEGEGPEWLQERVLEIDAKMGGLVSLGLDSIPLTGVFVPGGERFLVQGTMTAEEARAILVERGGQ